MNQNKIDDLLKYGYKIVQQPEYFKFSLDSAMLADFVNKDYTDKVLLDLCTGNAPIPVILSSKFPKIYGIELQKEIHDLAIETIKINNLKNVDIINDNVKNLGKYFKINSVDIITCNPPYFKYTSSSITNKNDIKTIARHEKEITLEEIIKLSSIYLKDKGKFYLIHRTNRLMEIIDLLNKYKFGIKKLEFCYDNDKSNANMVMIEAKKNSQNEVIVLSPIFTKNYRKD